MTAASEESEDQTPSADEAVAAWCELLASAAGLPAAGTLAIGTRGRRR